MTNNPNLGWVGIAACAGVLSMALGAWVSFAIAAGPSAAPSDEGVPETSIVPAESASAGAQASPGAAAASPAEAGMTPGPSGGPTAEAHHARPAVHHTPEVPAHFDVEPADAVLKVVKADWVYSEPAKSGKHLEQLQENKFIRVTGATHYFLRVHLKNGDTGYIDPASVDMLKPIDKIYHLSHNAAVLEKPNKWSKKLSEVHQGHDVHVIAISLNYAQIRMRSGLEGFIPLASME
jgi:hypothetical protein